MIFTPNPAGTAVEVAWNVFYVCEHTSRVETVQVYAVEVEHALYKAERILADVEWRTMHAEAVRA